MMSPAATSVVVWSKALLGFTKFFIRYPHAPGKPCPPKC